MHTKEAAVIEETQRFGWLVLAWEKRPKGLGDLLRSLIKVGCGRDLKIKQPTCLKKEGNEVNKQKGKKKNQRC